MPMEIAYDDFCQDYGLQIEMPGAPDPSGDVVMPDKERRVCVYRGINVYCDAARVKNIPSQWGKACTVIRARPSGLKQGVAQFCHAFAYFVVGYPG